MRSERKHCLSTGKFPVSTYVGSSKNLNDLKEVGGVGLVGLSASESYSVCRDQGVVHAGALAGQVGGALGGTPVQYRTRITLNLRGFSSPKPKTLNLNSESLNPKPETLNPKP